MHPRCRLEWWYVACDLNIKFGGQNTMEAKNQAATSTNFKVVRIWKLFHSHYQDSMTDKASLLTNTSLDYPWAQAWVLMSQRQST